MINRLGIPRDLPDYSHPECMTKEQLLAWAKWNYDAWANPQANPHNCEPAGSSTSWYILFLWGERE